MKKARVLVILRENFSQSHGGALWAITMLQNMASVPDMEFMVVSCGANEIEKVNRTFVEHLGFQHLFVPLKSPTNERSQQRFTKGVRALRRLFEERYYFFGESECRRQTHVDVTVSTTVSRWRPDLIVINDLWSSLLVPTILSRGAPYCFIALDDYVAYQVGTARLRARAGGAAAHNRFARWLRARSHWVANMRIRQYVKRLHRCCTGIVTLTQRDVPDDLDGSVATAVLPPILEKRPTRWCYGATRSVFFVGNVQFFPNRLAVEWICDRLAPDLLRLDRSLRINIVGASEDQIRGGGGISNVSFKGYASRADVVHHMSHDDLFIAPIASHFGAKLKLAECVAHGMPLVATDAALSGLPFLTGVPRIDLRKPAAAARLVMECLRSPDRLIAMSERNDLEAQDARARQVAVWAEVLRRSMRGAPRDGDEITHGLSQARCTPAS